MIPWPVGPTVTPCALPIAGPPSRLLPGPSTTPFFAKSGSETLPTEQANAQPLKLRPCPSVPENE